MVCGDGPQTAKSGHARIFYAQVVLLPLPDLPVVLPRGKELPDRVERETLSNRMEIALANRLVFVHAVLKWLHHLSEKNVMLLHPASFSHDFLHASTLESLPGDWLR